jgi:hypothetical protein
MTPRPPELQMTTALVRSIAAACRRPATQIRIGFRRVAGADQETPNALLWDADGDDLIDNPLLADVSAFLLDGPVQLDAYLYGRGGLLGNVDVFLIDGVVLGAACPFD